MPDIKTSLVTAEHGFIAEVNAMDYPCENSSDIAFLRNIQIGQNVALVDGRAGKVLQVSINHGRLWVTDEAGGSDIPVWPSQVVGCFADPV